MLMGIALLPLVAPLLLFFGARIGAILGALSGCGAMFGIALMVLKVEVVELPCLGSSISRGKHLGRTGRWLPQSRLQAK